jgi:threonine dehydrogenase-like Zn-dependent dehydrogenase
MPLNRFSHAATLDAGINRGEGPGGFAMQIVSLLGNSRVAVTQAPDPLPGPGEVVVRTAVSALCGSELKRYRGGESRNGNSGHEAAGTVIALGAGVTSLAIGQRVGLSAIVGCAQCDPCAAGRYTWCANHRFIGNMHAEQICIPAHGCHPLPHDLPWSAGVLLSGDGVGVPFHTATRLRDPAIRTVAIFGVGPIGLGNLLVQRFQGRQVLAVDLSPTRLELAEALGAAQVIDASTSDPVARIRDLTGGRGADVCLEAAGRAETLKQCFAAVATGGVVVMNGEQPGVELSPSADFIRRDITAFGSWYYHFGEFAQMLALYRQGLAVEKLITHHYPLADVETAFREFAAGRTGKVLLHYGAA